MSRVWFDVISLQIEQLLLLETYACRLARLRRLVKAEQALGKQFEAKRKERAEKSTDESEAVEYDLEAENEAYQK